MRESRENSPGDYRLGTLYAAVAAMLIAVQEPFSALAARQLDATTFVGVTQVSLLSSLPLLLARAQARRDFVRLICDVGTWPKLGALFVIGYCGLSLYNVGLGSAHPIIAAAVLNLSPFWAAAVGFVVSRKPIPGSPAVFVGCFGVAFVGAIAIAWSQMDDGAQRLLASVIESALHSRWIYALPMPIFFALSGTLVYTWFSNYDEGAAVGANFLVSATILIPIAAWRGAMRAPASMSPDALAAVALLLVGTLASSAAGRVCYQAALSATCNDNGFVTMFFLAIPALSALMSWPLSHWIPVLRFLPDSLFFTGLVLVSAPLFVFARSLQSADCPRGMALPGRTDR